MHVPGQKRGGGIHGDEQIEKNLVAWVTLLEINSLPPKIGPNPKKEAGSGSSPSHQFAAKMLVSGRVGDEAIFCRDSIGCTKKLGND